MAQRLVRLLAIAGLALAAAPTAYAQQNLFNVPVGEVTAPNKLFFQQQFSVARPTSANTTISYGLGGGWEVGFNAFRLDLIPEKGPAADDTALFLLNGLKAWEVGEHFNIGLGAQLGQSTADARDPARFADFVYLVGEYKVAEDGPKFYLGGYHANRTYRGGGGDPFGLLLGCDVPINDKFSFVGDWVTGRSGISVAVLGGVYRLTEEWQLSLGAQLPSPHSHNPWGAVVELTFEPKREKAKARGGE